MSLVQSDTPMMRQFNALKELHPDCILFFRAGDFYEMFGQDAETASEVLGIALTTRHKTSESPVPMAGVPYHAYEQYLNRLTEAGFKVAVAEQMEDAAQAKGVVRREVVRVVTPGTATSDASLEDDRPHYLMAIEPRGKGGVTGLAMADLSTGHFEVAEFAPEEKARLLEFVAVERPREVLLPAPREEGDDTPVAALRGELERRLRAAGEAGFHLEDGPGAWFEAKGAKRRLSEHFETANLAGFGVEAFPVALRAAGALLAYLTHTQKTRLAHLAPPHPRLDAEAMWLDEATISHLELFDNRAPGAARHTLFAVLNQTRTAMGARLLRRWLMQPLLRHEAIQARHEAVGELMEQPAGSDALREAMARVRDLERIVGRVALPTSGVAEVVALRDALGGVQFLPPLLREFSSTRLAELAESLDPCEDVYAYLLTHIQEEPSLRLGEGGYIAEGVIGELDTLRALSRDSRTVISELEAREREATGIGSMKVRFNRVFGYYLEVPKTQQHRVPEHFVRKQTLVNAERYVTTELEEIEEKILGAEERIAELEQGEFSNIRTVLSGYARRMQVTASRIAEVDALAAFAEVARHNHYTRPVLIPPGQPRRLRIEDGRHPVIERIDFDEPFVPNSLAMSTEADQIVLITGPNMAGKSTVMRQVALTQMMAQAGSFVPAAHAELPLVDRIFTRVGASDSIARGQSTFMMEMNEAANILNNATPESLIILDEIGRGTSTYDGISIAWAMVEHLHKLGALTLFATHYHELTQLAQELPRLRNFTMSITEEGERLVFTRMLIPGEADKSYGIQVARLAGLPQHVVARAHEVMDTLLAAGNGGTVVVPPAQSPGETESEHATAPATLAARARQQLSFLADAHPMLERLRALDVNGLTPRQALEFLFEAKAKLEKDQ